MICRTYQSVFSSDVFATTTSLRMPSTSCAYHSGKVSLSPTTTSTPYGSTELSRSFAKSAVSVNPRRGADDRFPKKGTSASTSTGEPYSHERGFGSSTTSLPSFSRSVPNSAETDSQMKSSPSPAHTPHAEKLHRKK